MHKGNLQVGGGGALAGQAAVQQASLLRRGGLVADLHGVTLLQGQHIVPQGIQFFAQLARAGIGQLLHGVDAQQKQKHITRCDAEFGTAVGQKRLLDPVVERHDLDAVLIAPLFIRPLAEDLLQAGIAAGSSLYCGTMRMTLPRMLVASKYFSTLTRLLPSCT